ncbi:Lytic polysaccharide mono-oxygenase [Gracilaria domingensis]|nr:Lytic polysaccharide mono-oxygenase [Gracilaria domingensis]
MFLRRIALLAAVLAYISCKAHGHGAMVTPRQRGSLRKYRFFKPSIDEDAPLDYFALFPSGVKSSPKLTAKESQKITAGVKGWNPYDPYDPKFSWRAGVCGDSVWRPQDHLKGGEFYYNGTIVGRYRQGGTIGLGTVITAHHNGFMEVHVCDVAKCPDGDISRECFAEGGCVQLNRAANAECDSGKSMRCGPIDRNYPGRWYLPCSRDYTAGYDFYPPEYALFQIPNDFYCEHCVLQWYWATANDCNPPGVMDYFDGPDRPNWGNCPGQSGAKGGVTRNKEPCEGPEFYAEEYWQCADIAIEPVSGARSAPRVVYNSKELTSGRTTPRSPEYGKGVFKQLLLWADNAGLRHLKTGLTFDISMYDRIGIEAVVNKPVAKVDFYVDHELVYTGHNAPYFLYRDTSEVPFYWNNKTVNSEVTLGAEANGELTEVTVMFKQ